MTTAADDSAAEEAFEACLTGRRPVAGSEGLGAFVDAVRMSAITPGRPSPALAQLLASGLLTDQSSSSPATDPSAEEGARRSPVPSRKRRSRMITTALFMKLASAGLLAKAATVAGVAVVGLTTAGSLGGLPAPVQHTFATVVDKATPFTAPDPATSPAGSPTARTSPQDAAPAGASDTAVRSASPETANPTGAHPSNFGQAVSSVAHSSTGVDGQSVSSMAHQRNGARTDSRSTPPSPAGHSHPTGSAATGHQPAGAANGRGASESQGNR